MEEEFTETGGGGGAEANSAPEPDSTEDKEYEGGDYDDGGDDDGNNFRRNNRMQFRGRGRGPPPGWMNGPPPGCPPPMRFRGRGYGPSGPPMRGARGGFFRGRGGPGGPRFNGPPNGPNFDGNWGPMGPPPMMGGPPPYGPPPMMGPGGPMGPPPSLMGQPPFGGPPGMPPPNMMPELWVETKSDDGKSYYYHSRTRETTWTRPQDTPSCKVITQAEMESMAASGQMPGLNAQPMGMNGPMGGPPMGMPPGMMGPNGMMGMMPPNMGPPPGGPGGPGGQPPGPLPPFMGGGFPPWIKDPPEKEPPKQINQDSNSAGDSDEPPPGDTSPAVSVPSGPPPGFPGPLGGPPPGGMSGPPPGALGGPPPGALGGPPPGFPGAWGSQWSGGPPSWPPPLLPPVNQPPPNVTTSTPAPTGPPAALLSAPSVLLSTPASLLSTPVSQPSNTEAPPITVGDLTPQPEPEEEPQLTVPPELAARAAEWTTHKAPDGRPYYYCAKKQESVWEKPAPLKELDEMNEKIAAKNKKPEDEKMEVDKPRPTVHAEVIDVEAHEQAKLEREAAERRSVEERERQERERVERERLEREKAEREKIEKEKAAAAAKAADKSRPITSTPISGTPWCVVWTGDGRVFFYNPTAHSSVWERPEQLIGRADVDKAVSSPPEAVLERQKKEALASGAAVQIGGGAATGAAVASANGDLKRAAEESDSDDSEPEPAKKAKQDDGKKPAAAGGVTVIDAGKEAAIEAEVRAARERAVVPLELRIKSFRQMLQEKEVSAFSTWEKELHKIVFDSRYLLLTSKERKQVFDKYVRERAEEERKEKRNRLKQKKDSFRLLMEEAKLHAKSSFNEFAAKYAKDERLRGIEKTRERESLFNEYIVELRKKEKEEKAAKREQVKKDFVALLREKDVDRHARWVDVKKKIDADARYKAVESSAVREDLFREYCKLTKDEKKKDKDKEKDKNSERESRSSRKDKKEKEREKEKEKEKEKKKDRSKEKGSDQEEASEAEAAEAPGDDAAEETAARERAARAEASIKEREKEVQRALATSLRDRDKEREYHKRDEAVQHFNALLADLVRNPDLAWRDARKQLKKDHRYTLAELLSKEDKERLFTTHTSNLAAKRRDKFRELLDELNVSLTAYWRDVKKKAKDDPRAAKFATPDKCEREFRDYQRDRLAAAKLELRALLQETRTLSHRTLAAVKENKAHLTTIQDSLSQDARYLVLNHIPEERDEIITTYLEELEKKGPPPPPTATEPSRRPNK